MKNLQLKTKQIITILLKIDSKNCLARCVWRVLGFRVLQMVLVAIFLRRWFSSAPSGARWAIWWATGRRTSLMRWAWWDCLFFLASFLRILDKPFHSLQNFSSERQFLLASVHYLWSCSGHQPIDCPPPGYRHRCTNSSYRIEDLYIDIIYSFENF